ncbi:hypothetical protein B5S31_g5499 [[Candida] boidinii]|nr:hypothetical protein B5S31_g5499 [[Candida] boidinii]
MKILNSISVILLSLGLSSALPNFIYENDEQEILNINKDSIYNNLLSKYESLSIIKNNDLNELRDLNLENLWDIIENNIELNKINELIKSFEIKNYKKNLSPLYSNIFSNNNNNKINQNIKKSKFDDLIQLNNYPNYDLRIKNLKNPEQLGVDTVKQYTGYFDINGDEDEDTDKHLFYWFFESRNDPVNDPIILWLNGGPGCSSMTGLFFELGPSSIFNESLELTYNPYSWNANASVIFLEQPVGVGYSYTNKASSEVSSTKIAAKDVYVFLELFFKKFPNLIKNDFHITGESYAGHYIPNIASEILDHESERSFNLTSIMIGNGITDPLIQYDYYGPMACGKGGYEQLISDEDCDSLDNMYKTCSKLINTCYKSQNALTCVPATLYCERMMGPFEKTGLNYYDIRTKCEVNDLCYKEMGYIDNYLNKPEVMTILGCEVEKYTGCDDDVFRRFLLTGDEMKPFQQYISKTLESNIPVLIYAGDKDYICNWLGNKAWVEALEWEGQGSFNNATDLPWLSNVKNGEYAGDVKSNGLLTFLRVFNAGHMVPYNQPENSLDMVNRWIQGDYTYSD